LAIYRNKNPELIPFLKSYATSLGVGAPGSGSPLQSPKKLGTVALIFKIGIKISRVRISPPAIISTT
jgi:hypothetical protein